MEFTEPQRLGGASECETATVTSDLHRTGNTLGHDAHDAAAPMVLQTLLLDRVARSGRRGNAAENEASGATQDENRNTDAVRLSERREASHWDTFVAI